MDSTTGYPGGPATETRMITIPVPTKNTRSVTCNKVMMAVGVVFILAAIAFGVYGGLNNFPMEQLVPITAGLAVIGIALLTIGCCRIKGAVAPQNGPGTPTNPSSHRGGNPGGTRGDSHHRSGSSAARRGHGEPHATRRGGHRGTHHSRRHPEAPSTPTFVYSESSWGGPIRLHRGGAPRANAQPDQRRIDLITRRLVNLSRTGGAIPQGFMLVNLSRTGGAIPQGFMFMTSDMVAQINSMSTSTYYVKETSLIVKTENGPFAAVLDNVGDDSDMEYYVAYLESQGFKEVDITR